MYIFSKHFASSTFFGGGIRPSLGWSPSFVARSIIYQSALAMDCYHVCSRWSCVGFNSLIVDRGKGGGGGGPIRSSCIFCCCHCCCSRPCFSFLSLSSHFCIDLISTNTYLLERLRLQKVAEEFVGQADTLFLFDKEFWTTTSTRDFTAR